MVVNQHFIKAYGQSLPSGGRIRNYKNDLLREERITNYRLSVLMHH